MGAVIPREPCGSCGLLHDLYLDDPAGFAPGGGYTYACPATGATVAVRPEHAVEVARPGGQ